MRNIGTLSASEMMNLTGGGVAELVQAAWDATPDGGSSHWANNGDCFIGTVNWPDGHTSLRGLYEGFHY